MFFYKQESGKCDLHLFSTPFRLIPLNTISTKLAFMEEWQQKVLFVVWQNHVGDTGTMKEKGAQVI